MIIPILTQIRTKIKELLLADSGGVLLEDSEGKQLMVRG